VGAFAFLGIGLTISIFLILFENLFYTLYLNNFFGHWSIHLHKFLGYTNEESEKVLEEFLMNPDQNPAGKATIECLTSQMPSDNIQGRPQWITKRRENANEIF